MKFIPFIVILLLSFHFTSAQSDFRPGYILVAEGDTTRGWIAYREGNNQYTECVFKISANSEATHYSSTQLLGYGFVKGKQYSANIITKDSVTSTLFSHVIVRGKASLLRAKGILYLKDEENNIYELSKKELGITYHKGIQYARNDENQKKGILIWKMSDYPEMRKKIERIRLDAKQLTRIFEEYNAHANPTLKPAKDKLPWTAVQFGPVVDFTHSKISNVNDLRLGFDVNSKQFSKDKSLSPGLSLFFSSPRLSEKIWTHIDILYQQKSFESLLKNKNEVNTFELNYTTVTVPISFSYHFTRYQAKLIPLIEAGIIFSSVIKNDYSARREIISANEIRISNYQSFIQFTPTNLSGLLGLGVSYKVSSKISAVVRARASTGLTNFNVSITTPAKEYNYSLAASLLYTIK